MENLNINNSFVISRILRKHIQRQPLSQQEAAELERWLSQSERNKEILASVDSEDKLSAALKQLHQTDTKAQLNIVNRRINRSIRSKKLKRWVSVAASLTVFLGISLWIYNSGQAVDDDNNIVQNSVHGEDLLPGSNRATLTLSSGETIQLKKDKSGIISTVQGLSYEDGSRAGTTEKAQYATLTTPVGGQYKLTLPDGSTVWLNAESSLQYPIHFDGQLRQVILEGEAFFEVAHNASQPFIVQTANQHINVLGTSFNVKAYTNEQRTTTTLLTGLVKITMDSKEQRAPGSERSVMLYPNQQAIHMDGHLTVNQVVPTYASAWKNGKFAFRNEPLANVMKQLQRWYGFSMDDNALPPLHFTGGISREVSLSEVLTMLEETSSVRFQIKNKHVSILNNQP